jgi:LPS sulfotransferase NodH
MLHYLICSTPRVGSNLLCSLLFATRAVGHPREYFCPHQIAAFGPHLVGFGQVGNAAQLHRFLDAAAREYGSEGRFGIKAHLAQLRSALELGYDFEGRFPHRFIHMSRADILGQAMSLVRASQTGAWMANQDERAEPRFDPQAIRARVQQLTAENQAWEHLFRRFDIEPYRLSYEGMCADFEGELSALLAYLDVDPTTVDVAGAVARGSQHVVRQRDARTEEWREAYAEWLRDRARRQHATRAAVRVSAALSAAI